MKKPTAKQSARQTVIQRLEELGWERNRLATYCHERGIGKTSVYEFIAGTREVTTATLDTMFEILGLGYVVVGDPKPPVTR